MKIHYGLGPNAFRAGPGEILNFRSVETSRTNADRRAVLSPLVIAIEFHCIPPTAQWPQQRPDILNMSRSIKRHGDITASAVTSS
jgi:hypothetical protein